MNIIEKAQNEMRK